ncbi:MAG: T9SS type A sorting domain-containing protein [Bacteroidetes bacterium]|nr:T9SS type A sorting domain-containing protein [Bacteroidota bacterium]
MLYNKGNTCYGTIGIADEKIQNAFLLISPNPTNGIFYLSKDLSYDEIKIYNTYGQAVAFEISNKNEINISAAPTGLYFVKVSDGKKYVAKVMKE